MQTQHIEFPGSQDVRLVGSLEQPKTASRSWALFAHCFTCSKDSKAALHISRALVERGFGVLRFGFTGLGGSVAVATIGAPFDPAHATRQFGEHIKLPRRICG